MVRRETHANDDHENDDAAHVHLLGLVGILELLPQRVELLELALIKHLEERKAGWRFEQDQHGGLSWCYRSARSERAREQTQTLCVLVLLSARRGRERTLRHSSQQEGAV